MTPLMIGFVRACAEVHTLLVGATSNVFDQTDPLVHSFTLHCTYQFLSGEGRVVQSPKAAPKLDQDHDQCTQSARSKDINRDKAFAKSFAMSS